ncbi:MAG: 2,3-bisphosphoglycerate-independent phosphoglycerate mutase [Porticoccaceae bacterium]
MNDAKKPLVLLILDGWGHSDAAESNAIAAAQCPVWRRLWSQRPTTLIQCSGLAVGLPEGQMGNSEVGHMTIGAGRVIYQNFTRINKAISDGEFFANPAYIQAIDTAVGGGGAVHILGLLSQGGVHSHEDQMLAVLDLAAQRGASKLYLHAFLDGRDTPPRSARASLEKAAAKFRALGIGRLASITGRYYAMDRDQRWDRTQLAYELLTEARAEYGFPDALTALEQAYARGENDEFVRPTLIRTEAEPEVHIADGDAVIFMNFRPDRARQLTHALVDTNFSGFPRRTCPRLAGFVMTTEYGSDIAASCAFPTAELRNTLGEYLSSLGRTQLRIAETEKYAHVTFFFNGGREEPYPGEDRILVPSPKVATYDLQPEMSAPEVTDQLIGAIHAGSYDLIVCNFANGDMVGHTGIFSAAVKAVEALDQCLGRITEALAGVGGECLITADHGNVEEMLDHASGQVLTSHTTTPIPLVYCGRRSVQLAAGGSIADVAPTVLALLGLPQPADMTGHSLISAT